MQRHVFGGSRIKSLRAVGRSRLLQILDQNRSLKAFEAHVHARDLAGGEVAPSGDFECFTRREGVSGKHRTLSECFGVDIHAACGGRVERHCTFGSADAKRRALGADVAGGLERHRFGPGDHGSGIGVEDAACALKRHRAAGGLQLARKLNVGLRFHADRISARQESHRDRLVGLDRVGTHLRTRFMFFAMPIMRTRPVRPVVVRGPGFALPARVVFVGRIGPARKNRV